MDTIAWAERGWLPDAAIRYGIRRQLRARVRAAQAQSPTFWATAARELADRLRQGPVAIETDAANQQHYEVPPEFFERVLGPRMKYSCGYWEDSTSDLASSEEAMLRLSCQRAGIENGMRILDLGCGWGSLSLFLAEKFPECQIVGVSNSASQRASILQRAAARGLRGVEIITADARDFQTDRTFDRVMSVEMFEHMRNYRVLLSRIAQWLQPDGKLFVHIFCHRDLAYTFDVGVPHDWMARHFFTGGLMPSANLLQHFQDDLRIREQWTVSGDHYARTCEAWLDRLDRHGAEALRLFQSVMPPAHARIQVQRWRMFFMACAELFRYGTGEQWYVGHYLWTR